MAGLSETERLIVDYFEATNTLVEHQDGEWFIFCGEYGAGVSLTGLAIEIVRLQSAPRPSQERNTP